MIDLRKPDRYYFDGVELWCIYEITRTRAYKRKKRRFAKVRFNETETEPFFAYHSTISKEKAELKYPEYFL